jgi:uncharacterized membrane protein YdbT with pleckstrin-like domain
VAIRARLTKRYLLENLAFVAASMVVLLVQELLWPEWSGFLRLVAVLGGGYLVYRVGAWFLRSRPVSQAE